MKFQFQARYWQKYNKYQTHPWDNAYGKIEMDYQILSKYQTW